MQLRLAYSAELEQHEATMRDAAVALVKAIDGAQMFHREASGTGASMPSLVQPAPVVTDVLRVWLRGVHGMIDV